MNGFRLVYYNNTGIPCVCAVRLANVTTVRVMSQNKLTGEGCSFSIFGRDAARETNLLATLEASLTMGGTCTVCERALASTTGV